MKKLGKRIKYMEQSIQAYACACSCECSYSCSVYWDCYFMTTVTADGSAYKREELRAVNFSNTEFSPKSQRVLDTYLGCV